MSFELGDECEFTPIESRCVTMLPKYLQQKASNIYDNSELLEKET